jgi:hypothetical protein
LLKELSREEYKVASYLFRRLEYAPSVGFCLTDAKLSKITGVSVWKIPTVRKSLKEKSVVRWVRGRGIRYLLFCGGEDTEIQEWPGVVVPMWKPGAGPTYAERMSALAEKLGRWR